MKVFTQIKSENKIIDMEQELAGANFLQWMGDGRKMGKNKKMGHKILLFTVLHSKYYIILFNEFKVECEWKLREFSGCWEFWEFPKDLLKFIEFSECAYCALR